MIGAPGPRLTGRTRPTTRQDVSRGEALLGPCQRHDRLSAAACWPAKTTIHPQNQGERAVALVTGRKRSSRRAPNTSSAPSNPCPVDRPVGSLHRRGPDGRRSRARPCLYRSYLACRAWTRPCCWGQTPCGRSCADCCPGWRSHPPAVSTWHRRARSPPIAPAQCVVGFSAAEVYSHRRGVARQSRRLRRGHGRAEPRTAMPRSRCIRRARWIIWWRPTPSHGPEHGFGPFAPVRA